MAKYLIYTFILFISAYGCSDVKKNETKKWTEEQENVAIENCVSSGNLSDFCDCSVSVLATIFSYDEFVEFDSEIRSGQRPSQAIVSKMIQMSKRIKEECPK